MITEDEEQLLAELPLHPAWTGLKKVADERKRLEFNRMVSKLIQGQEVTKEDIAYKRGYFDGLAYLFREIGRMDRIRSEERG